MVQLLLSNFCKAIVIKEKFQFHYGSIITEHNAIYQADLISFQFHYGSIITLFQLFFLFRFFISIPLWFNYYLVLRSNELNMCKFQFHYGSIITSKSVIDIPFVSVFQFHYGSIITCQLTILNRHHPVFQFHYGSIITRKRIKHTCGFT